MIVQHRSFQKFKERMINHLLPVWTAVIAGIILQPCCFADFDVNAVAGIVSIDGSPAPGGTLVLVCNYGSNFTHTTMVDGKNIPPFMKGEGRYDTGDVPELSTGDRVEISLASRPDLGSVSTILQGGTTILDLQVMGSNQSQEEFVISSSDSGSEKGSVVYDNDQSHAYEAIADISLTAGGNLKPFGSTTLPTIFLLTEQARNVSMSTISRLGSTLVSTLDMVGLTFDSGLQILEETVEVGVPMVAQVIGRWEVQVGIAGLGIFGAIFFVMSNRHLKNLGKGQGSYESHSANDDSIGAQPFWDSAEI